MGVTKTNDLTKSYENEDLRPQVFELKAEKPLKVRLQWRIQILSSGGGTGFFEMLKQN